MAGDAIAEPYMYTKEKRNPIDISTLHAAKQASGHPSRDSRRGIGRGEQQNGNITMDEADRTHVPRAVFLFVKARPVEYYHADYKRWKATNAGR